MKFRLQLIIESDAGEAQTTEDVTCLDRCSCRPEEIGLTLAEAKQLLGAVQQRIVHEQVANYLSTQSHCAHLAASWRGRDNMRSHFARCSASCA